MTIESFQLLESPDSPAWAERREPIVPHLQRGALSEAGPYYGPFKLINTFPFIFKMQS